MAYTVLARRYRSQTFDDVIGQEAISQTLKNAIEADRVSHAYLFSGTRGVGKTTMARILAKALNCLAYDKPTVTPCCECDSCVAINTGDDIDVIEIDGASNNKVEHIHDIRQNAIYRPARSRFKIYIIDEVHMLSNSAFNALLKTLEEPPAHVKFIFATTEPNKVLATIQSRCQRFDFKSIDTRAIAGQLARVLESEGIGFEQDVLTSVARLANGSMRDGLSILDQLISSGADPLEMKVFEEVLGEPGRERIANLLEQVGLSKPSEVLNLLNDLLFDGMTPLQIVDSTIEVLRDMMVVKAGGSAKLLMLTTAEMQRTQDIVEKFDIASIIYAIASLEKIRYTLKDSATARVLLEAIYLRLTLSDKFIGVSDLIKRIDSGQLTVKKKLNEAPIRRNIASPAADNISDTPSRSAPDEAVKTPEDTIDCSNLEELKSSWDRLLSALLSKSNRLGHAVRKSQPTEFSGGKMVLEFGAANQMAMRLCEHGSDELNRYLSEIFAQPTAVSLKISESTDAPAPTRRSKGAGLTLKDRDDAARDPGVKMLTDVFNAKIVGIKIMDLRNE